jgi:hypothetical protein
MSINSTIAPTRTNKFTGSRDIYNSDRYCACVVSVGLVVQSHRSGLGKLLPNNHPQYADYVEAILTAIDNNEGDALCHSLMN